MTGLHGACAHGSKYKQTDISGAVHCLFIGGSDKMAYALTLVAEKAAAAACRQPVRRAGWGWLSAPAVGSKAGASHRDGSIFLRALN